MSEPQTPGSPTPGWIHEWPPGTYPGAYDVTRPEKPARKELQPMPLILRRRPSTVEAMRVEENNLYLVATWCQGVIASGKGVWVVTDTGDPGFAHVGQWVVRGPAGFYPASEEALWAGYEALL